MNSDQNKGKIIPAFPKLANDPFFEIIDGEDPNYNCIAWAGNVKDCWWSALDRDKRPTYSLEGVKYDWPYDAEPEFTVDALTHIFESMGFELCVDPYYEKGYKKIAFYQKDGEAKHAARQLTYGKHESLWSSKLGQSFLILHETPDSLESVAYGKPTVFMKKSMK